MSGCETVVLRMMDRHLYIPFYSDRKRLYLKHLRYWNHVLNMNKIDVFLSASPPHDVYDYVLYSLCKLKNIPTIYLYEITYSDVILIMDDWENISSGIKEQYNYLLSYYKSRPKAKIELRGEIKKEFEYQLFGDKTLQPNLLIKKPFTYKNLLKMLVSRIKRFIFLIKTPLLLLDRILFFIKRIFTKKYLFNFYNKNSVKPNMRKKYIYFPLHMQPEASTSPLAGAFVDQILAVQMVASKLPKNHYIYVKEHPTQTDFCRDVEFYKELLNIPQVRLIPRTHNTFDLINNSVAVATATGTAGWEGLFRNKPVLLFGHCFYQYAKGVFMIKTNNDCHIALDKIINQKFKPNLKAVKIYLKTLEKYTIDGKIYQEDQLVLSSLNTINNQKIIEKLTKKIVSTLS
jgi:hypothetical protein